jgi:hypothetical protein
VEGVVVQGILQGRREVGYWVLHCIVYIYFIPHPHLLQLGGAGKCVQEFDYRKYLIPRRRVLIGRRQQQQQQQQRRWIERSIDTEWLVYWARRHRVTLSNASRAASERLAQTMRLDAVQ